MNENVGRHTHLFQSIDFTSHSGLDELRIADFEKKFWGGNSQSDRGITAFLADINGNCGWQR